MIATKPPNSTPIAASSSGAVMLVSTHAQSIYREHQDNDRVVGAKVARVVGDALDGLVRVARAAHAVVVEEFIHGAH